MWERVGRKEGAAEARRRFSLRADLITDISTHAQGPKSQLYITITELPLSHWTYINFGFLDAIDKWPGKLIVIKSKGFICPTTPFMHENNEAFI